VLPGVQSPARGAIPFGKAGCVAGATDQRGEPRRRPSTGKCDIGSVEAAFANPKLRAKISASHHKSHGWYRGPVRVSFDCVLGSAPLTHRCPVPKRLHHSGHHKVRATIVARDGGKAAVTRHVKIDNSKPTIRVFVTAGKVRAKCHDTFSGMGKCHVVSGHDGSVVTFVVTARDKAGNVSHKRGKFFL
jgi:hypothetical protein